jgi:hypothetical protein
MNINIKMFDISSDGTLKEWLFKFYNYCKGV